MFPRTEDSSDDTIITSTTQVTSIAEEYTTETFETDVTQSQPPSTKAPPSSVKKNYGSSAHSPTKLPSKSPKRSESESEDSICVAHSGEYSVVLRVAKSGGSL